MANILTPTEAAYVAGLIDGEGCITASISTKRSRVSCSLSVTNTNQEIVRWLMEKFGVGSVHTHKRGNKPKNWKTGYVWKVSMCSIPEVLDQVLPFMRIKAKQATVALSLIGRDHPCKLVENHDFQFNTVSALRRLNIKGVPELQRN